MHKLSKNKQIIDFDSKESGLFDNEYLETAHKNFAPQKQRLAENENDDRLSRQSN